MLPTAIAYVVVIASASLGLQYAGISMSSWQFAIAMLAINVVMMVLIVGVIDRGRLISPAYSRLDKRDLAKLRQARYDRASFQPATSEGGAD
jgi:hypothetical protein